MKDSEKNAPSFMDKITQILEEEKFEEIVSWTEDGKGFVIKNPGLFTQQILPLYFKHKNYSSFVRQLNMYDFKKSVESRDLTVFKHPCFLKDRPELHKQIHRKTSEKNWSILPKTASMRPELTPYLYRIYVLYRHGVACEDHIKVLEEKVGALAHQNNLLLNELMTNCTQLKKMEKFLFLFIYENLHTVDLPVKRSKNIQNLDDFLESFGFAESRSTEEENFDFLFEV